MAYVIESKEKDLSGIEAFLPAYYTLQSGQKVQLVIAKEEHYEQMRILLNATIEEGGTYPQDSTLSPEQFKAYYLAGNTFCVIPVENQDKFEFSSNEVLGCFYIKPNFPGHCSHICNGGFITKESARRKGIARFMGSNYLQLAKALGFKASMFNLVFVTNTGSLHLWRSLNFKEIGRIPNAGYYPSLGGYVDAIQFYYDLTTL